jgi:hypothetical protein
MAHEIRTPLTPRSRERRTRLRLVATASMLLILGSPGSLGWDEWKVGVCAPGHGTWGGAVRFDPTKDVHQERPIKDIDYYEEVLSTKVGGKKFFMFDMRGPSCCSRGLAASFAAKSGTHSERTWTGGTMSGFDAHGVFNDGTNWRYVGPPAFEGVWYNNVPSEAAKAFDSVLDSMCVTPGRQ